MDIGTPTQDEINAMSTREFKVFENRLRRAAGRQGLRLEKSRRRDPRALGYGTYMLVDIYTDGAVASHLQSGYGLGLEDVARALQEGLGSRPQDRR